MEKERAGRQFIWALCFVLSVVIGILVTNLSPNIPDQLRGPAWLAFVAVVTIVAGAVLTPWRDEFMPLGATGLSLGMVALLGAMLGWLVTYFADWPFSWGLLFGAGAGVLLLSLTWIVYPPKP